MRYRLRRIVRRVRDLIPPPGDGALVLVYHRAAELAVDPWRLAVSPAHLAEHLDVLARCTRPTTAAGLRAAFDAGRIPERTVVVTFDDGYADLVTAALPLLDRSGIPATMFLVSDAIDRKREFWWDALERVFLIPQAIPDRLSLQIAGQERVWELGLDQDGRSLPAAGPSGRQSRPWRAWQTPPTSRHAAYKDVWQALRGLVSHDRDLIVDELLAWAGHPVAARPTHRTLRSAELARLAGDSLVEIGAHTVSHPSLAALPAEAQSREIADGKLRLEDLLGRPVQGFAYPYGSPTDIGPETVGLVRETGFDMAFTMSPGRVRGVDRTDPYRLPRVFVDDLDGEGFGRLLWRSAGIRVS